MAFPQIDQQALKDGLAEIVNAVTGYAGVSGYSNMKGFSGVSGFSGPNISVFKPYIVAWSKYTRFSLKSRKRCCLCNKVVGIRYWGVHIKESNITWPDSSIRFICSENCKTMLEFQYV